MIIIKNIFTHEIHKKTKNVYYDHDMCLRENNTFDISINEGKFLYVIVLTTNVGMI